MGVVLLNGFRSEDQIYFAGYLEGQPSRASRDKIELVADRGTLCRWLNSQEARLRKLDLFTHTNQIQLAYTLYRANHTLASDHHVAMTIDGLLRSYEVRSWAQTVDEIVVTHDWPIQLLARPVQLIHYTSGTEVQLPKGWICPATSYGHPSFDNVLETASDKQYEQARLDLTNTWQKEWWQISGHIRGFVVKMICEAWECDIGEILEPVEKRGWSDFADIGYEHIGEVPVYRLNRPARRT